MIYTFRYTCLHIILLFFLDIHADTKSSTPDTKDTNTTNTDTPPKAIAAIKYEEKATDSTKKDDSSSNNNASNSSTNNSSSDNKEKDSNSKTPEMIVKPQNIITSVYIQNNFGQSCVLKKIEILLENQTKPFVKDNLNIKIAEAKKIYTRGTITAFDITTTDSINNFNGIKNITIDSDTINFDNPNIGSSKLQPILITKKNGQWVLDK